MQLKREMTSRHLFMISLGGIIGTGLFLGSGLTISQAGPLGAVLSYIVGGTIMYLTMLCLGELAVYLPVSGSFQTYTTRFIGPGVGFAVGWIYWLGWAVTVALEITAAGSLMDRWFPNVPVVVWCTVFTVLLFGLNAVSAKAFGEAEFWFSSLKVLAILFFIILGGAAWFGWLPMEADRPTSLFANFTASGWFPNGILGVLTTMIAVNFAFQGTELIGVAAGESDTPEKSIPKAIRNTVWRTFIFFVLSITIVGALIPYETAGGVSSPFIMVFDAIGIPYAADLMNIVVLTALLSVGNSGLYAATRMLWAMAQEGMISKKLSYVNARGVPMRALLFTMMFAMLSLLTAFFAEDTVFIWLLSLAGLGAQVGWISISASQLAFRRQFVRNGHDVSELKFKTPLYPVLPLISLTLNVVVLVSLAFQADQRIALYIGVPFFLVMWGSYHLFVKGKHLSAQSDIRVAPSQLDE
ncbi:MULTISPECIES: amino acid permease [Exiguobacterium]|uniref:amino acid permease n=1 Tax=unclassified Exiguobacterium TaxID=2644629 RepID=UPI001BE668D8|nr:MULTISPECIES: amino acid permease [Exiguobacterium]